MTNRAAASDPFTHIRTATNAHRAQHGCGAYPYFHGPFLGVLAAASNARRILELGTALGYTALWFAHGAPDAVVDSIEADPEHVRLARQHVEECGMGGHVVVHEGDFITVLGTLDSGYDVAFFDGFAPTAPVLAAVYALLRTRGTLISANLTHAGSEAYCEALLDEDEWLTAFIGEDRETAISIKL
jgi:predicted O-methyltransferase YrrM